LTGSAIVAAEKGLWPELPWRDCEQPARHRRAVRAASAADLDEAAIAALTATSAAEVRCRFEAEARSSVG
jgi:hypothetical protein